MTKKKDPKDLLPVGRPTKYYPELAEEMLKWFDRPHLLEHEEKVLKNDGTVKIRTFYSANQLPTFEKFSVEKDLDYDTLLEWSKDENKPEFSGAYKKCKKIQKDMLVDLATRGFYNANFTKFVAINITDMRDVVITKKEDSIGDVNFDNLSTDELRQLNELLAKSIPKTKD
jgi:hypothetical protein